MKQIALSDVQIGMTIKAIDAFNEHLTILFTDDTFINVEAVGGEFPFLRDDNVDLECKQYLIQDADRFIAMGILDREKYESLEAAYLAREHERNREHKRHQYEQLKQEIELEERILELTRQMALSPREIETRLASRGVKPTQTQLRDTIWFLVHKGKLTLTPDRKLLYAKA